MRDNVREQIWTETGSNTTTCKHLQLDHLKLAGCKESGLYQLDLEFTRHGCFGTCACACRSLNERNVGGPGRYSCPDPRVCKPGRPKSGVQSDRYAGVTSLDSRQRHRQSTSDAETGDNVRGDSMQSNSLEDSNGRPCQRMDWECTTM